MLFWCNLYIYRLLLLLKAVISALALLGFLLPPPGYGQTAVPPQPWQPPEEPASWTEVRRALLRQGPDQGLRQRQWIFVRALDRADLRAGEYLANLAASDDPANPEAVDFNAVVLIQRPGQSQEWQVRERRMRVLCPAPRMEAMESTGTWVPYTPKADAETAARLAWMCSRVK